MIVWLAWLPLIRFGAKAMEPIDTYTEIVGARRRKFTLHSDRISVLTSTGFFGISGDVDVPLEWLTPSYGTVWFHRFPVNRGLMAVCLILSPGLVIVPFELRPPNPIFFAESEFLWSVCYSHWFRWRRCFGIRPGIGSAIPVE